MDEFKEFYDKIENPKHVERMKEVSDWVSEHYPQLETKVAWNQPMFTDHGTFIIAFGYHNKYMTVAPEKVVVEMFSDEIKSAGFEHTKMLIKFPWDRPVNYKLLAKMIEYNIEDKKEWTLFWRK
jgi:hypothetical protein